MASQKIKLTDQKDAKEWTYKEIEDLMVMAVTQKRLADFLGVSHDTVQRQKERDPEFASAIDRGKRKLTEPVTKALMHMAVSRYDLGAAKYVLNNLEPDEWAEKTKTEVKAEVVNISNILNELEK
jgi:hypothetical protein